MIFKNTELCARNTLKVQYILAEEKYFIPEVPGYMNKETQGIGAKHDKTKSLRIAFQLR